jgi:chain length determinant protein tyrosine kinase EpsG
MKSIENAAGIQGASIGDILLSAGKLTDLDLKRIMDLQSKEQILFGEAAVSLGILNEEDVRWALASQFSYPCLKSDDTSLSRELLVVHEPFSQQVEAFRTIRSGLILSGAGKIVKTIGVLSPGEKEGKTFVAANLAIVFAQLGSKTVLVDLNFRKPRVHELFHIKNNTGASSLIIKRALLEQAVNTTSIASLDILSSGPKPPNPLELLGWSDAKELIDSLKERYDIIIVDTPASSKSADAMVISGLCDGILLIALKGSTKNDAIGALKKQLDNSGKRIMGLVINEIMVPAKK